MVVSRLVGGIGRCAAAVDGDNIEDWVCSEEAALDGLRVGSCSRDFDPALDISELTKPGNSFLSYMTDLPPIAFPNVSSGSASG